MHPWLPSKTTRILAFPCIVFVERLTPLRSHMYGVGILPVEVPT
jgi:hypothetical protein